MASVYIETTIPSFYFETRADQRVRLWRELTRVWWTTVASQHRLVTSTYVIEELEQTAGDKRAKMLGLLDGVTVLPDDSRVPPLAAHYIEQMVMPDDESGDAAHIAAATVHGIEFVLTWNIKHLANVSKQRHLRVLNRRRGFATPDIVTPEMFRG
jgi:hypothetical protein